MASSFFGTFKVDDFGTELFGSDFEEAEGDGEFEAAGAAGARVEVEDSFFVDVVGDVGVAVKDGGELGGGGVEVDGLEVVEEIEVAVFEEDDFGFGEFGAGSFAVDVAADGGDGGDGAQLVEDGRLADVAQVEYVVYAAEGGENFGAEEAVGVGEDADAHGVRIAELARYPVVNE